MKPALRWIVPSVVFAAFAAVAGGAFLLIAGPWLSNDDRPEAAGAILVLSGEPLRALHAAELYSRGLAPVVYVSRPALTRGQKLLEEMAIPYPPQEHLYQEILVRKGVPQDRIRILGKSLLSTVDEATAARDVDAGPLRTILVVTSPYHVRRVKMTFGAIAPGLRTVVVANPHEPFPEHWWTDQDVARNVVLETIKIAYFMAGGRFTSMPSAQGSK